MRPAWNPRLLTRESAWQIECSTSDAQQFEGMDSSAQAAPLQPLAIACTAAACILLHLLWYFKSLIIAGIRRALAELRDDPQVFQTPTGFHLRVTAAPGKGLGIFAEQQIPQGTYLGLYAGELIDDNEFERRYKDLHRQAPKSSMGEGPIGGYVFGLGNGYSMDAEDLRFSNWCGTRICHIELTCIIV